MTIDMHRDTSLREASAYAIFGSRTENLKLPSASDRSRYTAVRNLPSENPSLAVKTMEETACPPPKLNPAQKQRRGRRTRKPALCYTVYWEADYDKRTELAMIDDSLTALYSSHLQTLIVGRSDYPKRTHVIVNVISPISRRVCVRQQPYYELLEWHLTTISDPDSTASLGRGMIATVVDSLQRQDHRLLDLPPYFAEAVRGVPGYGFDTNTLRLVMRAGPSTFHESRRIDTLHAEINEIDECERNERAFLANQKAFEKKLQHKRITRRKILLGEQLHSLSESLPSLNECVQENLNQSLTNPFDRSLFGLPNKNTKLLYGFRPKKYQHEWCAAYNGDPTTLPDNLDGYSIEIQPYPPNPAWVASILTIIKRSDEELIVGVPPRNESYPYVRSAP